MADSHRESATSGQNVAGSR